MTSSVIFLTGLMLVMKLTSSVAYPARYYSSRLSHYDPELDAVNYYFPYFARPAQSRSFEDHYYEQPYQVSQWPGLLYNQWLKTQGQRRQEIQMRHNADSIVSRQGEPIPGAFLVPANVNGAFAGPLAVIPAHYGGAGAVTNSGSPGAQYLAIIDGPNWPFIGRPKGNRVAIKKSQASDTDYVPSPDGPNWPYIGVNTPNAESRSSIPMDYNEQDMYASYFPIDYPVMYNPKDSYLYHNY
ncbi:hypothetical protein GHT06_009745 [Daphnia sinensis]|uniref:Uncharacterized protein n=1 Tax=Daphnia sinensis TaxID=1820382 RepID=A0AAD5L4P0_9CRUS|nr:hypothetical protein GHT06_009745 [Daphnia sinensis]